MVTINYFPTSVQRLYKIGGTGEWLSYKDQPVKVNQGQTIYAKGIDQHGNETRVISQHIASVGDAIGAAAYDGDNNTYHIINEKQTHYINIDSSMQGKNVKIKVVAKGTRHHKILFINSVGQTIIEYSPVSGVDERILNIPAQAVRIAIAAGIQSGAIYEIYEFKPII